jgi:hypothetical protein
MSATQPTVGLAALVGEDADLAPLDLPRHAELLEQRAFEVLAEDDVAQLLPRRSGTRRRI